MKKIISFLIPILIAVRSVINIGIKNFLHKQIADLINKKIHHKLGVIMKS